MITIRDAVMADAERLLEIYGYYTERTAISFEYETPSIDFCLSLGAEPMSDWTVYRITGDTLTELAR